MTNEINWVSVAIELIQRGETDKAVKAFQIAYDNIKEKQNEKTEEPFALHNESNTQH